MTVRIINADVMDGLRQLPDESVHCVVTSPPYWGLRDYGAEGQIGLEPTPEAFVERMVAVFREVRRVLRSDGSCWLNLGDSYAGHNLPGWRAGNEVKNGGASNKNGVGYVSGLKPKDLIGVPWRVAFALQADGWWLRSDIIWAKPNPMPESVTDRPTKAHEYVFPLTKSERYWYDAEAIKEPAIYSGLANMDDSGFKDPRSFNGKHRDGYRSGGKPKPAGVQHKQTELGQQLGGALGSNDDWGTRNKRSVWTIATSPFPEAHFATFPPELPEICIKAGCPVGGTVLDPFSGAGTTVMVADRLQRNAIGIELNPEYAAMAERRVNADRGGLLDLMEVAAQ